MGKWQLVVLCVAVLAASLAGAWLKVLPSATFGMCIAAVVAWLAPSPVLRDVSKGGDQ